MRFMRSLLAALGLVLSALPAGPAEARRVALVIGNADYKVGPLQNPVNDATAVAEAFQTQLKFDKVILKKNLGSEAFRAALREISSETAGAEIGVVYFAGHGTEVGGKNFLIPVDATLAKASALTLEAIPLDGVLEQLDGVSRLRLVILDACRNNIFQLAGAKRSYSRGLVRIEPEGNTLVAYAAKEGTTADDGKGRHSPYTAALLRHLTTPGLEIQFLFRKVRSDVLVATAGAQQPAEYHSLGDKELFLLPPALSAPVVTPVAPPLSEAAREWARVDRTSIAELETFRRRHPSSPEAEYALARIEELKKRAALEIPPAPKSPAPVAPVPALKPEPAAGAFSPSRATGPLTAAEERTLKPGHSFKECEACPEMVAVPAGSFTMGSPANESGRHGTEGPQHGVTIAGAFAAGKFEVTRGEYAAFVGENRHNVGNSCLTLEDGQFQDRAGRSFRNPGFDQNDRHPAVCVSWQDATTFVGWLSRKTGKTYRLLSEAEWEYAARAGTATRYHFGNSETDLCSYGNVADQTAKQKYKDWAIANCRDGYVNTAPVGKFRPNPFGLYDMHGNVWEWVQDCWNGTYNGAPTDGVAWTAGDCASRVVRGGSSVYYPQDARSAARDKDPSGGRGHVVGFRVGRGL